MTTSIEVCISNAKVTGLSETAWLAAEELRAYRLAAEAIVKYMPSPETIHCPCSQCAEIGAAARAIKKAWLV